MQSQDLESVTAAEPNEQIDICERQPYQAPSLVQLGLKKTSSNTFSSNDGAFLS